MNNCCFGLIMGLYDNACDKKKGTPTLSKSSLLCLYSLLSFTSHLLNQLFLTVSEVVRKFHIVGDNKVAEGTIASVITLTT